jgi:hypothetical protein
MLFNHNALGETRLARSDGGAFDLLSISLAELPSFDGATGLPVNFGPYDVNFTGTKKNGHTVSFTATAQPFPETDTFKFKGFSQLISVVWHQGGRRHRLVHSSIRQHHGSISLTSSVPRCQRCRT